MELGVLARRYALTFDPGLHPPDLGDLVVADRGFPNEVRWRAP